MRLCETAHRAPGRRAHGPVPHGLSPGAACLQVSPDPHALFCELLTCSEVGLPRGVPASWPQKHGGRVGTRTDALSGGGHTRGRPATGRACERSGDRRGGPGVARAVTAPAAGLPPTSTHSCLTAAGSLSSGEKIPFKIVGLSLCQKDSRQELDFIGGQSEGPREKAAKRRCGGLSAPEAPRGPLPWTPCVGRPRGGLSLTPCGVSQR